MQAHKTKNESGAEVTYNIYVTFNRTFSKQTISGLTNLMKSMHNFFLEFSFRKTI